jgi:predicted outer membrane lipoprotein
MTDALLVSALVGFTLSALTFILGGDVAAALAVLAAGGACAFALVTALSRPESAPAVRRTRKSLRVQRLHPA